MNILWRDFLTWNFFTDLCFKFVWLKIVNLLFFEPHSHGPSMVHVLHGVYLFFSFVGDQTQTSSRPNFESFKLWCLFTKSCWNINALTMLWILFSLSCVKYIFFWFYQSVGFEGNNKYAKKGFMTAMECADVAPFTFATWQIRWRLLCKFILLERQSF